MSHVQLRFAYGPTHNTSHVSSKITGMHGSKADCSPPRRSSPGICVYIYKRKERRAVFFVLLGYAKRRVVDGIHRNC